MGFQDLKLCIHRHTLKCKVLSVTLFGGNHLDSSLAEEAKLHKAFIVLYFLFSFFLSSTYKNVLLMTPGHICH